jgi:hypothetical protein
MLQYNLVIWSESFFFWVSFCSNCMKTNFCIRKLCIMLHHLYNINIYHNSSFTICVYWNIITRVCVSRPWSCGLNCKLCNYLVINCWRNGYKNVFYMKCSLLDTTFFIIVFVKYYMKSWLCFAIVSNSCYLQYDVPVAAFLWSYSSINNSKSRIYFFWLSSTNRLVATNRTTQ